MTREKILMVLGAAGVVGAFLVIALWLSGNQAAPDAVPTPTPVVTIDAGEQLKPEPLPSETSPTGTPTKDGHTEGDEHSKADACVEGGPVVCGETDAVVRNTAEDVTSAATVRPVISPFVMAWAKIDPSESSAARAARLSAAGASPTVAGQTSALARADSTQTGLTAMANPQKPTRILFMGRTEDGLLKFKVTLDVDAKYSQPDDSASYRVVGGSVYVSTDDSGVIDRVTEDFPTIKEMR